MKIGLVNNSLRQETRVAATPQTVKKFINDGHFVLVEQGAGQKSGFDDGAYLNAGAVVAPRPEVLTADFILSVLPPRKTDLHFFKEKQWLLCNLSSFDDKADLQDLAKTDIGVIDMGKMPRISRAQTMDILSSQSVLAGYKAALIALNSLHKTAPLLMTSAGTLVPAKAVVIGAGVAGLSAISTLKRMGANVVATDIRFESKAEIESVGGKFSSNITAEIASTDILICAAFSAGKKAPLLIKKSQIEKMPFKSVVIDMANGNVEPFSERPDIYFIQDKHLERKLAASASTFFANNVYSFLQTFHYLQKDVNYEDEILRDVLVCFGGFLRGRMK